MAAVCNRTGKNKTACPLCAHAQRRSKAEIEIYEYVLKTCPDARSSDRSALGRFELDVYVPSINKAIEYDGTYWHSKPKDILRDRCKDARCVKKGVQLLRITEVEYEANKPATLLKILNFLKH